MLFYTVGQSRIFLMMLYAGLLVGLYLSMDSALRRLIQAGRIMNICMDLLFGVVLAGIVIVALMIAVDGELRLYALLGVLCGFLIYSATLGPLLRRLALLMKKPLSALLRAVLRLRPVKMFFK